MSGQKNLDERLVEGKMTYVFLDEIQNVPEFERTVDGLFINKNVDLYITGSNAYMLSSERNYSNTANCITLCKLIC